MNQIEKMQTILTQTVIAAMVVKAGWVLMWPILSIPFALYICYRWAVTMDFCPEVNELLEPSPKR